MVETGGGGMRVVSSPQKIARKVESGKMSPEFLREHCRKNDLYMIPHFNTILYLHHKVRYQQWQVNFYYKYIYCSSGLQRYRKSGRIHRTKVFISRK